MRRPLLASSLLALPACITIASSEPGALDDVPAYEETSVEPAAGASPQPFVGLDLEESISGSLEAMVFLGGLRVAAVVPGSPAEAAGIRVGDRLVKAGSAGAEPLELERVDQWSALLAQAKPGDSMALTLERDGGLVEVPVRTIERGSGHRGAARRFVERRKARCIVETEILTLDGRPRSAARIVELAPSSPLLDADLKPGDRLLTLDGVELAGAADFARRIAPMAWGTDVSLEVLPAAGGGVRKVDAELYEPERHWTQFQVWPLVEWAEPADETRSSIEIVDLWLIWLFKYERVGETRSYSILRFLSWETGVGALVEEPAAGASR